MKNKDRYAILLFLLMENLVLYFLMKYSPLLAIIINSIIMLILGYISISYNIKVMDYLEEFKEEWNKKKK